MVFIGKKRDARAIESYLMQKLEGIHTLRYQASDAHDAHSVRIYNEQIDVLRDVLFAVRELAGL